MAFLGSLRVAVYSPPSHQGETEASVSPWGGGGEGTEGTADASAFPSTTVGR